MADFYLKSGSATEAALSTAYALGAKVVIARADVSANYLVVRKWVLECTTAGTSGATVPAWPATVTQDTTTVTDGTVVWTFRKPGFSSGTTANWAFSAIYMDYVASAMAAGDTLYVSNNHTESSAVALAISFPGTQVAPNKAICVSDLAAPPTAVATTATVTTTTDSSAGDLSIAGSVYLYGVAFSSKRWFTIGGNGANQAFENSNLICSNTGNSGQGQMYFGSSAGGTDDCSVITLINCGLSLGHSSSRIYVPAVICRIRGGSMLSGSATPSPGLFYRPSAGCNLQVDGFSFSNLAATAGLTDWSIGGSGGAIAFRDIVLPAAWTGSIGRPSEYGSRASMYNGDNADTNYRLWIETYAGSIKHETTIVRTGGASDDTTTLAWQMATSANASYPIVPLVSDEIVRWNETTASAITATVEIVHDSQGAGAGADFQNDEIWLEVMYLGTSGVPLGSFVTSAKADVLATAADITNSTETWTTTGLTTPVKQKLSVTFTPQEKGFIHAKVYLAKASKTVYVDPKITVS